MIPENLMFDTGYTGGRILKKTEDLKYKAICDVELNVMQSDGPNIKTSP